MVAIGILIPGLILGAIAWGAVGILRQRGREDFTLATAAAFYAQVALIAGVLAVLSGLSVLVKLGFSLVNQRWAYWLPPQTYYGPDYAAGPASVSQQQGQDVILAVMLVVIGALVAVGHWFLARRLRSLEGGYPSWLAGGWLVALTVLTGLAGALSLVVGGYTALTYFLVGAQGQGMTFADSLGAAIIFVPAWVVAITFMLRRVRSPRAPALPRAPLQTA